MLIFALILTIFLLGIFFYDLTRYLIPNWMNGILLLLYPVFLLSHPPFPAGFSVWYSLVAFAAVFILGIGIFVMRWAGGGDVKLLAVLSLWTGKEAVASFLLYTGLLGGVLALALLMIRPLAGRVYKTKEASEIPRFLQYNAPVPYGLAITVAFLILLWTNEIPGLVM